MAEVVLHYHFLRTILSKFNYHSTKHKKVFVRVGLLAAAVACVFCYFHVWFFIRLSSLFTWVMSVINSSSLRFLSA